MSVRNHRSSGLPVEKLFLDRWSPRSFTAEAISQTDLLTILEAARWAPSAMNVQPWRFLYAHRGDAWWDRFLDGLVPFNRDWAKNASVLVALVSDKMRASQDGSLSSHDTHSFDAGAAWAQLGLQAAKLGLHAHAMTGIDRPHLHKALNIPERYRVEAMIAIGKRGDPASLPAPLQEREQASPRKPLEEISWAGGFAPVAASLEDA